MNNKRLIIDHIETLIETELPDLIKAKEEGEITVEELTRFLNLSIENRLEFDLAGLTP